MSGLGRDPPPMQVAVNDGRKHLISNISIYIWVYGAHYASKLAKAFQFNGSQSLKIAVQVRTNIDQRRFDKLICSFLG